MEGDECYHFRRIKHFVDLGILEPITTILDIGANVGAMSRLMCQLFPAAVVHAFEPNRECFLRCAGNTSDLRDRIAIYPVAVTARHVFEDDLARSPRPTELIMVQAKPSFGPGWEGSHRVLPAGALIDAATHLFAGAVTNVVTLDEIATGLAEQGIDTIDLIKSDCEGAENSFLGCANEECLNRCRFIVGEWHDFARFSQVLEHRLNKTHNVNLDVDPWDAGLGSFFAERKDRACVLQPRQIEQTIAGQSYMGAQFRAI